MRECAVSQLRSGMVLGQALYAYNGVRRTLLLGRGAEISAPIVSRLENIGYSYVYIEEEGTEEVLPQDILSEESRANALSEIAEFIGELVKTFEEMVRDASGPVDFMKAINLSFNLPRTSGIKDSIRNIIEDLFIIGSVEKYETNAVIPRTNAIHRHALNVAVLSMLIGYQYEYTDPELQELGLGALLHDIGKLTMLDFYDKKDWELSPEEKIEMRKHPELGEHILSNSRTITEIVRQIIIQHHERQDGQGYPNGLKGSNQLPLRSNFTELNHIFRFAEIVAVANVFDNLVSGHSTPNRMTPSQALATIKQQAGTVLNRKIVETLESSVNLYPIGSNMKITSHPNPDLIGFEGVISQTMSEENASIEVILLYNKEHKRIPAQKEVIKITNNQSVELLMSR